MKDRDKASSRTQEAVNKKPQTIDFYDKKMAESTPAIPTPELEERGRLLDFEDREKGVIGGDLNNEDIKLEECRENTDWFLEGGEQEQREPTGFKEEEMEDI